jgi:hypothetical protein
MSRRSQGSRGVQTIVVAVSVLVAVVGAVVAMFIVINEGYSLLCALHAWFMT